MVAAHRTRQNTDSSTSQSDELLVRSEHVQRTPSARERFRKGGGSSSTDSTSSKRAQRGQHANNKPAYRMINGCLGQGLDTTVSAVSSDGTAEDAAAVSYNGTAAATGPTASWLACAGGSSGNAAGGAKAGPLQITALPVAATSSAIEAAGHGSSGNGFGRPASESPYFSR